MALPGEPGASDRDRMKGFIDPGGETPRLLFEPLEPGDPGTLLRQMKGRAFDTGLLRGIARRCPFGKPQVVVCGPVRRGKPFPTTFWLTCPFLERACARLESAGAVGEMEAVLSTETGRKAWAEYNEKAVLLRSGLLSREENLPLRKDEREMVKRLEGVGIGGIRPGPKPSVKCLHLQVAAWLALGSHPAGEWLAGKLDSLECGGKWLNRCTPPAAPKEG